MNQVFIIYTPPFTQIDTKILLEAYQRNRVGIRDIDASKIELVEISPSEHPNIGIDAVRKLISQLSYGSSQNQTRLVIINQAHTLTTPAQNALLKTLEEPPNHTYINLVTSQPHKLLETIHSRSQLLYIDLKSSHQNLANQREQTNLPSLSLPTNYVEAINLANQFKQKELALIWLDQLVSARQSLPANKLWLINQAQVDIQANLNLKLTLEHYFFKLVDSNLS